MIYAQYIWVGVVLHSRIYGKSLIIKPVYTGHYKIRSISKNKILQKAIEKNLKKYASTLKRLAKN
jgi:hypothetical protein